MMEAKAKALRSALNQYLEGPTTGYHQVPARDHYRDVVNSAADPELEPARTKMEEADSLYAVLSQLWSNGRQSGDFSAYEAALGKARRLDREATEIVIRVVDEVLDPEP